jgi:hypothetical protein
MARWWTAIGVVAAVSILATVAIAGRLSPTRPAHPNVTAQARSAATEFFRSQNERRYASTCQLLSDGFIKSHALRDRRTCTAVMRVAFVWSGKIDFRIGRVTQEGDRVVVRAVADGAPGRLVLVTEDGALRILAVEGK